MSLLNEIIERKIIAIVRGPGPADIVKIVNALAEGGVRFVEITLNSRDALQMIRLISRECGDRMVIGAGTVLDTGAAHEAMSAGAKFIISPNFDPAIIVTTKKAGTVSIPGAFTPTEILAAFNSGGDIIKVFPASVQYIKDVRGPLSHVPLMPAGGINLGNIHEYLQAGAVALGIGSGLVDTRREMTKANLAFLTQKAIQYVQAVTDFAKNKS